jgi:chromosome segregation ATPase
MLCAIASAGLGVGIAVTSGLVKSGKISGMRTTTKKPRRVDGPNRIIHRKEIDDISQADANSPLFNAGQKLGRWEAHEDLERAVEYSNQLVEAVVKLERNMHEAHKMVKALRQEVKDKDFDLDHTKRLLSEKEGEVQSLTGTIKFKSYEISGLKTRLSKLQALPSSDAEIRTNLDKEKEKRLVADIAQLQIKVDDLELAKETTLTEISDLIPEITQGEDEVRNLKASQQKLVQELDTSQLQVEELTTLSSSLTGRVEEEKTRSNQVRFHMAARLEAMSVERRQLLRDRSSTQAEMEDMAQQIAQMTSAIVELKNNEERFETTIQVAKVCELTPVRAN